MVAPGYPLEIYEDDPRYVGALEHYRQRGFVQLEEQINDALVGGQPQDTKRLWSRKLKGGHVLRGLVLTVETQNQHRRTTVFQVLYTAVNDQRHLHHLTQGIVPALDLVAFMRAFEGQPEKGWKP